MSGVFEGVEVLYKEEMNFHANGQWKELAKTKTGRWFQLENMQSARKREIGIEERARSRNPNLVAAAAAVAVTFAVTFAATFAVADNAPPDLVRTPKLVRSISAFSKRRSFSSERRCRCASSSISHLRASAPPSSCASSVSLWRPNSLFVASLALCQRHSK
ncbi:hypothetical protein PIB30_048865 [Stylosanthes scabra]|uniref:PGG domain-containing protein n=1 Tax=Stylosanthes scabra TaxID=79078 RepID=A0ABU6YFF9_9FABA|nr:hypothetical protein [Stylosanthes scabra]